MSAPSVSADPDQPGLWQILQAEKANAIRYEKVLGISHVSRAE
jgi:hypothetical protein